MNTTEKKVGSVVTGRAWPFLLFAILLMRAAAQEPQNTPRFTPSGELIRPDNYREWIYLSSGLGMNYDSATSAKDPVFDNVFVNPAAYRSFVQTAKWPDKTIFVLELRPSTSEGSINKGGRFQHGYGRMEAEVKDEARFPGKWGFFPFETGNKTAKQLPLSANCYSCHAKNGAVDNTFVQFYPTLLDIAKQKGTFKATP